VKRTFLSLFSAMALMAVLAVPVAAEHGGEPTVIVMQHLCNEDIQSVADFEAVEAEGAGGQEGGEGTLPGLVATVLACPAVVLSGDAPTEGSIAAEPQDFGYTVSDGETTIEIGDAMFMAAKLCETDINLDADGSGSPDEDVCLDVSMYEFAGIAEGDVTVTQTAALEGTEFGTVRFTPASTDELALVSEGSTLQLDSTADTQVQDPPLPLAEYNDDVIVAHVYNFQTASAGGMPDNATEAPASGTFPVVLLGVAALVAAGVGTSIVVSRQRS
jgi:hypothetical protein